LADNTGGVIWDNPPGQAPTPGPQGVIWDNPPGQPGAAGAGPTSGVIWDNQANPSPLTATMAGEETGLLPVLKEMYGASRLGAPPWHPMQSLAGPGGTVYPAGKALDVAAGAADIFTRPMLALPNIIMHGAKQGAASLGAPPWLQTAAEVGAGVSVPGLPIIKGLQYLGRAGRVAGALGETASAARPAAEAAAVRPGAAAADLETSSLRDRLYAWQSVPRGKVADPVQGDMLKRSDMADRIARQMVRMKTTAEGEQIPFPMTETPIPGGKGRVDVEFTPPAQQELPLMGRGEGTPPGEPPGRVGGGGPKPPPVPPDDIPGASNAYKGRGLWGGTVRDAVENFFGRIPGMASLKGQLVPNYMKDQEAISLSREYEGSHGLAQLIADESRKEMKAALKGSDLTEKDLGMAIKGDPQASPAALRAVREWRAEIDNNTRELISRGYKPEELRANIGTYARRVYLRDIMHGGYHPRAEDLADARAYLQKSLMFEGRAATPAEIEGAIQQILSPNSSVTYTLGGVRIPIGPLIERQNIPEPIRRLMGEVQEGSYLTARTIFDQRKLIAADDLYRTLAKTHASSTPLPGYTPLPNTWNYGPLKGLYVPNRIFEDLKAFGTFGRDDETARMFTTFYFNMLNGFKAAHTIFNPTTHIRNIVGNVAFADFANANPIYPWNWRYYKQAADAIRLGIYSPEFVEALKAGAIGAEAYGRETLWARDLATGGSKNIWESITKAVGDVPRYVTEKSKLGALYNNEDRLFKLASYMKARAGGMDPRAASNLVNNWFPNYAEVGKLVAAVRGSRNTRGANFMATALGNPFASFRAEATRIGYNAFWQHPVKFFKWMALPSLMSYGAAAATGMSISDMRRMYSQLPSYLQQPSTGMVGFRDEKGNPMFIDFTNFHYLGSILGYNPRTPGLEAIWGRDALWRGTGAGLMNEFATGNPLLGGMFSALNNVNLFSGRPLVHTWDPTGTKLAGYGGELAQTVIPPWMPGGNKFREMQQAWRGLPGRYGQTRSFGRAAAGEMLGMQFIPIDAQMKRWNLARERGETMEAKRELLHVMSDVHLTPEERRTQARELLEIIREQLKPRPVSNAANIQFPVGG